MPDTLLLTRLENDLCILTFNRPETRNALDLATMQQFAKTIAHLSQDANLRVLILTGAGEDAFCSGGDLSQLSTMPSADEAQRMITLMGDALLALERLPVPVIAAVNGYALGGGSEIALACDLRIVDEKARVGLVQIRMGLTPGWGAGQRLLRLVGYARAMEILLRGQVMYPQEIEALGLANRVVEKGKALEHALTLAREIASQPPDVVRAIKTLLQAGLNYPYEKAQHIEREQFPPLWAADAHLKAVEAFLDKQLKHE
jgi:enoyl-CoA hydratase